MKRALISGPLTMPRGLVLAAIVALFAAALLLAIATWRAVRLDPVPGAVPVIAPAGPEQAFVSPASARPPRTSLHVLDNDPFRADRELPGARSVVASQAAGSVVQTVAPDAIRLLGTVVRPPGASFVVYQLPSEVPRTVRVGESVGGMTLVEVAPGRATFRAQTGALVELSLNKPGS